MYLGQNPQGFVAYCERLVIFTANFLWKSTPDGYKGTTVIFQLQ